MRPPPSHLCFGESRSPLTAAFCKASPREVSLIPAFAHIHRWEEDTGTDGPLCSRSYSFSLPPYQDTWGLNLNFYKGRGSRGKP